MYRYNVSTLLDRINLSLFQFFLSKKIQRKRIPQKQGLKSRVNKLKSQKYKIGMSAVSAKFGFTLKKKLVAVSFRDLTAVDIIRVTPQ